MAEVNKKLPENISLNPDQQREFNQKVNQIKKKNKHKNEPETSTGNSAVVYIGHIPHGFFEEQMNAYFSQFGAVKRLRIARSKKTGNIKGYAFVEFESDVVAKVVADCMNNYLMFHKLLKCHVVPEEKLHPDTFVGCDREFRKPKAHLLSAERHNRERTSAEDSKQQTRLAKKMRKSLAKLKSKGIDYNFQLPKKTRRKTAADPDLLSPEACQDMEVLVEDSSEDEISFRTPPNSVKSSKLKSGASTGALKKYRDTHETDTPVTTATRTRSRKRKAEEDDRQQETVKAEKNE